MRDFALKNIHPLSWLLAAVVAAALGWLLVIVASSITF